METLRTIANLLLVASMSPGCQHIDVNATFPADDAYYHDMPLKINGKKYAGVGVVPRSHVYDVYSKVRHKFDHAVFKSCNREVYIEDRTREFEYRYEPLYKIERSTEDMCLVHIGFFNKSKTQHYWGMFMIESDTAQLPATLYCNGKARAVGGSSICQARAGLVQHIEFKKPVEYITSECDDSVIAKTPNSYELVPAPNYCLIRFQEIDSGSQHRLLLYGYQHIFLRKVFD